MLINMLLIRVATFTTCNVFCFVKHFFPSLTSEGVNNVFDREKSSNS